MASHSHVLAAALLAMLAVPLAAPAQTSPPPLSKGPASSGALRGAESPPVRAVSSIQGVVVDEERRPLAEVRVSVLGPASAAATTDLLGFFRIALLPPGQYLVRARTAGYRAATSLPVELTGGVAPFVPLTLAKAADDDDTEADEPAPVRPVTLAAGFGELEDLPDQPQGVPAEEDGAGRSGDDSRDGGELAWRLRRLRRSPLKDTDPDAGLGGVGDARFAPEVRMASSLSDLSLTGEINFLTSGAFDSPQQLLSSNRFARNVAYASVGAEAGDLGTWAVRGAMTQGDVSSWILAGSLAAPRASQHAYDVGVSYSMQRYAGGNPAALAAVTDGARNAANLYGFDRWSVSPRLILGYGAQYSHYDYLTGGGWLSPRLSAVITPVDRLRVHALAARRMVAPGAEEFVPTLSTGLWLPPERTFSPLLATDGFRVERSDHYQVGVERDLRPAFVVAFRVYGQNVDDQLSTLFHVRSTTAGPADLGHYYVATAGDVRTRGWAASVSHEVGGVRSTIEYAQSRADWESGGTAEAIARTAGAAVRDGVEDLVDITTTVRAAIPQTATRVFVLYRISNGFARIEDVRTGARFNVQINQALPFMNFSSAEWEILVDVRNLFRDPAADASLYDELLVVNPPKRIVGGILVRF